MTKIKEVKFNLKGLHCVDCANKIEKELVQRDDVEEARVDMVLGTAVVSIDDNKNINDKFIKEIKKSVRKIDDLDVFLDSDNDQDHDHSHVELNKFIYFGGAFIALRLIFGESLVLNIATIITYFLVGFPVLKEAYRSIKNGQYFDETVLMSVATIGALLIGEYSESLGVMVFYSVGEYFQHKAVDDSRASIKGLLDKRPNFARKIVNGKEEIMKCEKVHVGDYIRVLPTDQVPLDGVVVEGESSLDTSSLTGESIPENISEGDEVLSGSINVSSPVVLEVTKEFSNSTITKMLDLIENSSKNKAKTEIFMTKFSNVYTPIVFALSIIIMIVGGIATQSLYDGLYRGLVFLVISCPCALVLSIPLGYFAGIGKASQDGILIKGGESIEAMADIEGVVFDKTGTLTEGVMKVSEVRGDDRILRIAAHLESFSNHPIGRAIVEAYEGSIDQDKVLKMEEQFGKGISAEFETKSIFVGSLNEVESRGMDVSDYQSSKTSVGVIENGILLGVIYLEDTLRKDSVDLIKKLHAHHVKTVLLSGDRQEVVDETAKQAGIDLALGDLLPDDKVSQFEKIKQNTKGSLAYVGDGMNDAAVLAQSDIGFSMGEIGNDLAIEYSDVVLVNDRPMQIWDAMNLAKKTQKITYINIIFILLVKVFVLVLGGFGLAKMWQAVIADVGVSLVAVLNAMRIMRK